MVSEMLVINRINSLRFIVHFVLSFVHSMTKLSLRRRGTASGGDYNNGATLIEIRFHCHYNDA